MVVKFIENRVLAPVQATGLLDRVVKVYPVVEVYGDEDGEYSPEAPHAWFASKHDARAFARLDSL